MVIFLKHKKINNYFLFYNMFYFYTYNYFFQIITPVKYNLFFIDKNLNLIYFRFKYVNSYYQTYFNLFFNIFNSFFFLFYKKLKFKGKGYYIFKNFRNTIAFKFGYSHRLYIYMYVLTVKFISKTTTLLFGINNNDLFDKSFELYYTRTRNIFTGKGIRFSKQIIYKKIGKVSSYR